MTLRVSSLDGAVSLTVPRGVPDRTALSFVREKADWIAEQRARLPGQLRVGIGMELPLLGVPHLVVPGTGRAVRLGTAEIAVPADRPAARLAGFLKQRARDSLAAASDRYAARLGRGYSAIALRDTRSRWGSCSSQGRLMFSWRLVMMPQDVLDYVAAHEVAHLEQMNHSRAFWDAVTRIHGPYAAPRGWLRTHGSAFHRFKFED